MLRTSLLGSRTSFRYACGSLVQCGLIRDQETTIRVDELTSSRASEVLRKVNSGLESVEDRHREFRFKGRGVDLSARFRRPIRHTGDPVQVTLTPVYFLMGDDILSADGLRKKLREYEHGARLSRIEPFIVLSATFKPFIVLSVSEETESARLFQFFKLLDDAGLDLLIVPIS